MQKTKPVPPTEVQAIARRIVDDVLKIQTADQWQDISPRLVAIQRSARQLLTAGEAASPPADTEEPIESAIANGYRRVVERQLAEAGAMLDRIDDHNILQPQTIGLCLMMLSLASDTMAKYMRASIAAESARQWAEAVALAEADMGLHQRRPLDIDGSPQDQDQDDDFQEVA